MAMMTALTSATSGMKSEQTALDVIANNIANVNTVGYKSQTVSFSDLLSKTIKNSTSGTTTTGSTNSQQIGTGVQVASTTTDTSVGSTQSTSSDLDVALTGSGYLVVMGSDGTLSYTRDGELSIDDDGNLNMNGYKVCGWEKYTTDSDGNKVYDTTTVPSEINVFSDSYGSKLTLPATETTSASFTNACNLDSSATVVSGATITDIGTTTYTPDASTTIEVYDAQGNETDVAVSFKKCAAENGITSWYWSASNTDAAISPASGYIAFDSDGKMVTSFTPLTAAVDTTNTAGYSDSSLSISAGLSEGEYTVNVASGSSTGSYTITLTDPDSNVYTATSTDGSATFTTSSGKTITLAAPTTVSTGSSTFTVTAGSLVTFTDASAFTMNVASTTNGTEAVGVTVDFSKITSTSTDSTLTCDSDGNAAGTADKSSYSIGIDGTISVTYSTGTSTTTKTVGQIALATFNNAGGLEKDSNNLYKSSSSSGSAQYVVAGEDGTGTMASSELELSNVDLASEFSKMMISQRAYQANSKVISTGDSMLQSLISMMG